MNLQDYLSARRRTIESSIAAERLAGNDFKLACERSALAEITAIECQINNFASIDGKKHCTHCDNLNDDLECEKKCKQL